MRSKFLRDEARNAEFLNRGYVHIPLLQPTEVAYLLAELRQACPEEQFAPHHGRASHDVIFSSYLEDVLKFRQLAATLVEKVIAPYLEDLLVDYRVLTCGFFVKAPMGGDLSLHRHWLVTESLAHTQINLWVPLVDTDVQNGTFHAIPGSHQIFPEVAYYGHMPYFCGYLDKIKEAYSVPLVSRAGQAVVFDDSLIHWSPLNQSDRPRYAIHCTCIPREARATYVHYDRARPDRFELYEVEKEFFVDNSLTKDTPRPAGRPLLGLLANPNRDYTWEEFQERMEHGDELRRRIRAGSAESAAHLLHVGSPLAGTDYPRLWAETHPDVHATTGRWLEAGRCRALLTSCPEALDGDALAQERACQALHGLFPTATVLLVTRADWRRAQEAQWLRTGQAPACELDYDRIVQLYRAAFGAERVLALPYELLREDETRFSAALARALEVPDHPRSPGPPPPDPTDRQMAWLRWLARRSPRLPLPLRRTLSAWLPGQPRTTAPEPGPTARMLGTLEVYRPYRSHYRLD